MSSSEIQFQNILANAGEYLSHAELDILRQAYQVSLEAHKDQSRAQGCAYITHPIAVCQTLTDLRLDMPTLAAGLLHDVLEDTTIRSQDLRAQFGEEITHLVEGVTKIDGFEHQVAEELIHIEHLSEKFSFELVQQAENWRKMLIATAHDIRIILLKLADRKHNMETLEFLPKEKQHRVAEETITLFSPLAQRLGMHRLKSSLEDLSFKYLEPAMYQEIYAKYDKAQEHRQHDINNCLARIKNILDAQNMLYRFSAREKNLYSIYRKMISQNKTFEEIQDVSGIRIVTDNVEHCYAILGMVHSWFSPLPGSFTDYIAMPKNNFYQSLHTTLHLEDQHLIELQIRTEDMHRVAEYGVAAHWRYKQFGKNNQGYRPDVLENKLDWIKKFMEWQQSTKNPREFLENLKVDLEFTQIYVFTPKGKVIKLPEGATPIDFAYAVHSDLGDQCIGARVDKRMVRLDTPLKSGSCCEVITRKGQNPHKHWLDFVKTPKARSHIRKYLHDNNIQ